MSLVILHSDMMACSFCNRGARQFCVRHGINWTVFVQQGIPVEAVEHIDDAMLAEVINYAKKRAQGVK